MMRFTWAINLVFVGICSYLTAKGVNTIVAGQLDYIPQANASLRRTSSHLTPQNSKRDLSILETRNLLDAKREDLQAAKVEVQPEEEEDLGAGSEMPADADMEECSLEGQLVATIAADDPSWSLAVYIPDNEREPEVFSVLEEKNMLEEDAELREIRYKAVVIYREDHFELCELGVKYEKKHRSSRRTAHRHRGRPEPSNSIGGGIKKIDNYNYEVEKQEVDKVLGNLSTVATQARIVPNFKNGKANGFKMFSIRPGSIYSKLGLKNGDIIQKINGYEMNSPDKALEIYQKLKDASSISVNLVRRGRSKSLNVSIR